MAATYTMEEVARHGSKGDAWVVIDGDIYDVSKFSRLHPGRSPCPRSKKSERKRAREKGKR